MCVEMQQPQLLYYIITQHNHVGFLYSWYTPELVREVAEVSCTVWRTAHWCRRRLGGAWLPGNRAPPSGWYSIRSPTFSQGKVVAMEVSGTTRQS